MATDRDKKTAAKLLTDPIRVWELLELEGNWYQDHYPKMFWDRVDAGFLVHGISKYNWQALAIALLRERYGGFTVMLAPPGGRPKEPPLPYRQLAREFRRYSQGKRLKGERLAEAYLRSKGGVVKLGSRKIANAKALLAAVKRGEDLREEERNRRKLTRSRADRRRRGLRYSLLQPDVPASKANKTEA